MIIFLLKITIHDNCLLYLYTVTRRGLFTCYSPSSSPLLFSPGVYRRGVPQFDRRADRRRVTRSPGRNGARVSYLR